MNSDKIVRFFENIIGERLQYICRTCDLLDIGFGDLVYKSNARGEEITVPTYALHVQCPFRITNANGIIIGSDDLFISLSEKKNDVDLSQKNVCILDCRLACYEHLIKNEIVNKVEINKHGDLNIYLSSCVISVFATSSTETESWRFFKTGKKGWHLVKNGIFFEIQ